MRRSRHLDLRRWKRGFDPCDIGVDVFEAELQLVVIKPFGTPAKLAALQLLAVVVSGPEAQKPQEKNDAVSNIKPGETDVKMIPINRMVPRSFVTNIASGHKVKAAPPTTLRGITFGGD